MSTDRKHRSMNKGKMKISSQVKHMFSTVLSIGDYGYGTLCQRIYKKNQIKMSSKRKFHYTLFEALL